VAAEVFSGFFIINLMAIVISIVSYPFLPAKTGGEKGVALFNKYFSQHQQLICVTVQKNDPAAAGGYEVLNILSNSRLRYINVFYFFVIRKMIKQKKATHVLLEHPYYGWLGILLKWSCRIKLIVHSHNMEALRWKTLGKWWWKILWQYEKYTHQQADYNFFIHDDDKRYAIERFSLNASRCMTMTYGIEWSRIPSPEEINYAKEKLRALHNIPQQNKILLFNGSFNYNPNLEALKKIIDLINPLLQRSDNFHYTIIICGINIPQEILSSKYPNIIIAGFVDDVNAYFKGADIFLNPVNEGGGIKTKLVEALGNNLNAVSTVNGAIGVDAEWCNNKLFICSNDEWNEFAALIIKASSYEANIDSIYFDHFYWGYTTKKAAEFIE
jgi:polysaccharide biosynthesis protein PslH